MNKDQAAQVVTSTGWLSRRPVAFQNQLLARCRLRTYNAGAALYHPGDPPNGMFGLVEGRLLMRMPPADTLIDAEAPGFWIGDATALRREPRWVAIVAGARSHVLHLSQADFDALAQDGETCRHLAINTAEALGQAVTVVANLTHPDSEVRVVQRLLTFAGLYGGAPQLNLGFSQSDLATMCGLSRQTMSRVLGGLVARNIIALGYRRLEILDFAALRALATDDERIWR